MEHTRISPAGASPAPSGVTPLTPDLIDTLAHHGLRELLFAPIPKVARALAGFDRDQLSTAIEVMIAMLDAADGDPDAEVGNDLEDDHTLSPKAERIAGKGPGCPVSDAPDPSVTEWHTRGRDKLHDGLRGKDGCPLGEDDEDDDPDHGLDEGEPNFVSFRGEGVGCPIGDPGGDEHDGREHEEEGGDQLYRTLPRYGVDQSLGPVNEEGAHRDYQAELRTR